MVTPWLNAQGGDGAAPGTMPEVVTDVVWSQTQSVDGFCVPVSVAMVVSEFRGLPEDQISEAEAVAAAAELGLITPKTDDAGNPVLDAEGNPTWNGMSAEGAARLLEHFQIPAHVESGTLDDLEGFIAEGRSVIVAVDAGEVWGTVDDDFQADDAGVGADHALQVKEVIQERDASGQPTGEGVVVLFDPGDPNAPVREMRLDEFSDAWADSQNQMIVTDVAAERVGVDVDTSTPDQELAPPAAPEAEVTQPVAQTPVQQAPITSRADADAAAVRGEDASEKAISGAGAPVGGGPPGALGGRLTGEFTEGQQLRTAGLALAAGVSCCLSTCTAGGKASEELGRPVPLTGRLSARTAALCERAISTLGAGLVRRDVERIRSHLDEPLRVAIAGRVSSGKSTLVNALLGRRVAATDHGECTQIVSVFRFAPVTSAALRFRDGRPPLRTSVSALRSLSLPALGVEPDEVEALDVYLDSPWLQDLTLLDTPGLASANDENSQVTREALGMMDAATRTTVGEADAVIYLFAHDSERASDVEALDAFQQSAMTAVGVLSRADTVGQGGIDSMETAARLAERIHGRVHGRVNEVVPVATLLAETVNTRDFEADELAALEELAGAPRERRPYWQLQDVLALEGVVAPEVRQRLYSHLGKFGFLHALELFEQGARTNEELEAGLRELSGIERVREVLTVELLPRADPLKANWAIDKLRETTYRSSDAENARALRELLDAEVDAIVHDPAMHELEEMQALRAILADTLLDDELRADAVALFAGRDAQTMLGLDDRAGHQELIRAVSAAARRWTTYEVMHDADVAFDLRRRRAAETVKRSYTRLWADLEAHGSKPSAARRARPDASVEAA